MSTDHVTDAITDAAADGHDMVESAPGERQPSGDFLPGLGVSRPQFGMRTLLISVTVFAVLLGLFRTLGIFGALVSFLFAAAVTIALDHPWTPPHAKSRRRMLVNLIWGVFMPIVCFVFDPGLLHTSPGVVDEAWSAFGGSHMQWSDVELYPYSVSLYFIIGLQVILMSAWLMFGRSMHKHAGFFAGALEFGILLSVTFAILLVIPSCLGIVRAYGLGLLGLTPWMTALAYYRACKELRDSPSCSRQRKSYYMGFATAIALPLCFAQVLRFW